jgi:thioredoxin 1
MAIIDLNSSNFESTINSDGIVLVDCWADWCKACKPFTPIFERIAARHSRHTFGKLNTQTEDKLVSKLGVQHIPTLMLYREGILLFQQPGYFDEEELESILSQAEALDMDVVRADIAAQSDSSDSKETSSTNGNAK